MSTRGILDQDESHFVFVCPLWHHMYLNLFKKLSVPTCGSLIKMNHIALVCTHCVLTNHNKPQPSQISKYLGRLWCSSSKSFYLPPTLGPSVDKPHCLDGWFTNEEDRDEIYHAPFISPTWGYTLYSFDTIRIEWHDLVPATIAQLEKCMVGECPDIRYRWRSNQTTE